MHYNFIEIGTSNYDTLIQKCNENHYGLSIEPLIFYLEDLPEKKNVKKICCAIITEKQYEENNNLDIFYIDADDIKKFNLNKCIKGCNSIGKPHDLHLNYNLIHNKSYNLVELGIVKTKKIKSMTYKMLIEENNVTSLNLLKTDTEGMDAEILLDLINYYETKQINFLPKTIIFENNSHSKKEKVNELISKLEKLHYSIEYNLGMFRFDVKARR